MKTIKAFYAWVCRVETGLAMLLLCVSTALIFVAAIMRYLGRPMNASLEISLFLFAWCVFLSADVGLREDRLVRLDMLTMRLPRKAQHLLSILSYSIILVFLFAMTWFGFILSWKTRVRTFQGIPNFSYTWVTVSLPIAAILMIVTTCIKIRGFYRQMANPEEQPPGQDAGEKVSGLPACEHIPPA